MSTEIFKGPYQHRGRWRFRVRLSAGSYAWGPGGVTESAARQLAEEYYAGRQSQLDLTVGGLVEKYLQYLRDMDRAESTVQGAAVKLRCLVDAIADRSIASVTTQTAKLRYDAVVKDYAAASHRTSLKYARMAWRWAMDNRLAKSNPWASVRPVGRANKGKPQLTLDEARQLVNVGLKHAVSDDGALAVMMALLMALRSSEITKRVVRDVDDGGRRLVVKRAKTAAGNRAPEIPDCLAVAISTRCHGRSAEALLLPTLYQRPASSAQWLAEQVRLYCDLAKVPQVCPHALRGSVASIAAEAGALPHWISGLLGHASTEVTKQHYITKTALASGEQGRRLGALLPKS